MAGLECIRPNKPLFDFEPRDKMNQGPSSIIVRIRPMQGKNASFNWILGVISMITQEEMDHAAHRFVACLVSFRLVVSPGVTYPSI